MVEVGYLGYPGAGGTYSWQIAEAITERTAAVACPILATPGTVPLAEVCAIAHERGVPVIVDAAAELPPRANLRRFLAEGADLVVFSGGKAIGGPQASGVLAGRADLIASVALQHQDMDVRPPTWSWRPLLATGRLAGVPHQGFGRAMKVGREEIVGLLVALRRYAAGSDEEDLARWQRLLDPIADALEGIPGIEVRRHVPAHKPVPLLTIDLPGDDGTRAYAIVNALFDGEPAIAIDQSHAEQRRLTVNPQGLTADEAAVVARRLRDEVQRVTG
jgi:L-seryl-tRNA(Ser) seleniumtransferase